MEGRFEFLLDLSRGWDAVATLLAAVIFLAILRVRRRWNLYERIAFVLLVTSAVATAVVNVMLLTDTGTPSLLRVWLHITSANAWSALALVGFFAWLDERQS